MHRKSPVELLKLSCVVPALQYSTIQYSTLGRLLAHFEHNTS